VPKPVAEQYGVQARVQLRQPLSRHHRSAELEQRLDERLAVRVDIEPSTDAKGRLRIYLRTSWVRPTAEPVPLPAAPADGVVGVDLNADHLAATRVDSAGNPVGRPVRVPLDLAGASAKTRDGRLRAAITMVLEHARATGATAIAVEDLDFADSKSREKFGRRKAFRHTIHGVPTAQFKDRVVAMAATQGLAMIAVDPRYTSRYGGASWQLALTTPRSSRPETKVPRSRSDAEPSGTASPPAPAARLARVGRVSGPSPTRAMEARPPPGAGARDGQPLTRPRPNPGPASTNRLPMHDSPPGARPDHRVWSRLKGCRIRWMPGIGSPATHPRGESERQRCATFTHRTTPCCRT
jgi:IS605 OrfB family transposase